MEKKNTLLLTVIAVATLLVAVVGATFAYFGSFNVDTNSSTNVNVTTGAGQSVLFKTTGTDLNYTVPDKKMGAGEGTTLEEAGKGDATLTVSLSSGTTEATTTCTYDVVYTGTPAYTEVVANEFTYTLTAPEGIASKFTTGTRTDVVTGTAASMKALQTGSEVAVATGETIISADVEENATKVVYNLATFFYNMPNVDQSSLANKSFVGALTVKNVKCNTAANK